MNIVIPAVVGPLEIVLVAFALVHLIRWLGALISHGSGPIITEVLELFVVAASFFALQSVPIVAMITGKLQNFFNNLGAGGPIIGILILGLSIWGVLQYRKTRRVQRLGWCLVFGFSLLALGSAWPPFGQFMALIVNATFGWGLGVLMTVSQAIQAA